MKRTFCSVTLFIAVLAFSGFSQTAKTTRYWDACKPSCSWTTNAGSAGACIDFNRSGQNLARGSDIQNVCGGGGNTVGGPAYTCFYHAPFTSGGQLYGFAASHAGCGKCFRLTFRNTSNGGGNPPVPEDLRGKTMIVMVTNVGDIGNNHFDIMIPGGGEGQFTGFFGPQISANGGPANPNLGAVRGGFKTTCGNNNQCIRDMCDAAFPGATLAPLREGCHWYVDDFYAADNPDVDFTEVTCPEVLTSRYFGTTTTYGGGGGQQVTTYTLNVSREPTSGGNVRVNGGSNNPGQSTHNANTAIGVRAIALTGYEFVNWTAVSGSLPTFTTGSATADSIRFNISANVNIRANFRQLQVQTYTVQVSREPTAGGNVRINNGANNPTGSQSFTAGTSVTVTATANTGYEFVNWTAVTGTQLPTGFNASSATATFTINSNVNVRANFRATGGGTTTYTVQVGRNPTAGGSVAITVGGTAQTNPVTVNAGTSVTISATAGSDYDFVNWTAVTGSLPGASFNASSASNTFTVNAAVNIRANFQLKDVGGGDCQGGSTYTLTVRREPAAGGNVFVGSTQNPSPASYGEWEWVQMSATANAGYEFDGWTLTPSKAGEPSNPPGDLTNAGYLGFNGVTCPLTVTANFKTTGVTDPCVTNPNDPSCGGDISKRTDTTKVEAEDYSEKVAGANELRTETSGGVTCIGYIENGNAAIYDVGMAREGNYTMVFRIASNYDQGDSRFVVVVNGQQVGTITGHTNDWDGYTYVTLSGDVPLNAGNNTIRLNFQTPVNVDYFLILGEPSTSVRFHAVKRNNGAPHAARVTIRSVSGGLVAGLPFDHKFTSYKLIDLRGRELKRGLVSPGAVDLHFSNVKSGVVFLRLEGKGVKPMVLRATTTK